MNSLAKVSFSGLWFAVSSFSVCGQENHSDQGKASELPISAAKVVSVSEERRVSGDGEKTTGSLRVEVEMNADDNGAEFLNVVLVSAKDDKGNDLLNPKRSTFEVDRPLFGDSGPTARLRLELPPRDAKAISEIVGTATFQDKSKAVKPVEIVAFRQTPGEYLKDPALEKFEISIAYLNEATFEEKGAALMLDSMGMGDELEDAEEAADGGMKAAIGMMKAVFELPNVAVFAINDPQEKLLRLEGVAGDGESGFYAQNTLGGLWMLHPKDTKAGLESIRIHIKSDQAEFTQALLLKDVKLP